MLKNSLLNQENFWAVVKFLGHLKEKTSFRNLQKRLNLSEHELNSFLVFMQEVGFKFDISEGEVTPILMEKHINLQLNLLEWLQFQAHFPTLSECQNKPYHEDVKLRLTELEERHKEHDLFKPIQALEEIFKNLQPQLVKEDEHPMPLILMFLEESILDKRVVTLLHEGKHIQTLPLKIAYFEGCLHLIGEHTTDGTLFNLKVQDIENVWDQTCIKSYQSNYSPGEIEGFVSSLRAMHEKVIRLVLKIYSHEHFGIHLNRVYFDNPCLFTNPQGDYIWAATLEPSPAVFEWLCEMGSYVEILDPTSFKREFLLYCEDKLKKLA
jgi:hypothetical protein